MKSLAIALVFLLSAAASGFADSAARVVKYHSNDIVAIKAKLRYTTLIQLPADEKILEVATGDKDFWIIDAVQNFCFLHPAKSGIRSNVNLITDKGNVYSFIRTAKTGRGLSDRVRRREVISQTSCGVPEDLPDRHKHPRSLPISDQFREQMQLH